MALYEKNVSSTNMNAEWECALFEKNYNTYPYLTAKHPVDVQVALCWVQIHSHAPVTISIYRVLRLSKQAVICQRWHPLGKLKATYEYIYPTDSQAEMSILTCAEDRPLCLQ